MATEISAQDLALVSTELLDRVTSGERFTITQDGVAVAELVPVSARKAAFVDRADLGDLVGRASRIDYRTFRADLAAVLDEYLD